MARLHAILGVVALVLAVGFLNAPASRGGQAQDAPQKGGDAPKKPAEDKKADDRKADDQKAEVKKADDKKPADKKPAEKKADDKAEEKKGEDKKGDDTAVEKKADEEKAGEKKDQEKPDAKKDGEKKQEEKKGGEKGDDGKGAGGAEAEKAPQKKAGEGGAESKPSLDAEVMDSGQVRLVWGGIAKGYDAVWLEREPGFGSAFPLAIGKERSFFVDRLARPGRTYTYRLHPLLPNGVRAPADPAGDGKVVYPLTKTTKEIPAEDKLTAKALPRGDSGAVPDPTYWVPRKGRWEMGELGAILQSDGTDILPLQEMKLIRKDSLDTTGVGQQITARLRLDKFDKAKTTALKAGIGFATAAQKENGFFFVLSFDKASDPNRVFLTLANEGTPDRATRPIEVGDTTLWLRLTLVKKEDPSVAGARTQLIGTYWKADEVSTPADLESRKFVLQDGGPWPGNPQFSAALYGGIHCDAAAGTRTIFDEVTVEILNKNYGTTPKTTAGSSGKSTGRERAAGTGSKMNLEAPPPGERIRVCDNYQRVLLACECGQFVLGCLGAPLGLVCPEMPLPACIQADLCPRTVPLATATCPCPDPSCVPPVMGLSARVSNPAVTPILPQPPVPPPTTLRELRDFGATPTLPDLPGSPANPSQQGRSEDGGATAQNAPGSSTWYQPVALVVQPFVRLFQLMTSSVPAPTNPSPAVGRRPRDAADDQRPRDSFSDLPQVIVLQLPPPDDDRDDSSGLFRKKKPLSNRLLKEELEGGENNDFQYPFWIYPFDLPARFPVTRFGSSRTCAFEGDGAVIHEGMRLLARVDGQYEVRFNVTAPAMPVMLKLQLLLYQRPDSPGLSKCRVPVAKTLTLPPIWLRPWGSDPFPNSNDPGEGTSPTTYQVSVRGYSQVIKEVHSPESAYAATEPSKRNFLLVKRIGTARFGSGVRALKTEDY
jgi:hypothetical protein